MADTTAFQRCVTALREVNNSVIHVSKIRYILRARVASNETRVTNHIKMLVEMGAIKEVEPFVFEITLPNGI